MPVKTSVPFYAQEPYPAQSLVDFFPQDRYTLQEEKCEKPLSFKKYTLWEISGFVRYSSIKVYLNIVNIRRNFFLRGSLMKTSRFAGLGFGQGLPKICIPITAKDIAGLTDCLLRCSALPGDLFEWRLDHYTGDPALGLHMVRQTTRQPLLCTLRTKGQGGEIDLGPEEYARCVLRLIEMGEQFELIDIELCAGDRLVEDLVRAAHEKGLGVIISQHNFKETPPRQEMLDTLLHMRNLGADLPKLAVMPSTPLEVFDLMSASWEAFALGGPVVTMSMGPLGQISRAAGSYTGSCMTFGAGTEASAPGQLDAGDLKRVLTILGRGLA